MLHGLSELIERDQTAIEKGTTINRRLDALRTAIEETNAEREFHVGNRLRNGGLR
jgi:ribosomal protein S12 methylthiotransferase accessory factor YcaO